MQAGCARSLRARARVRGTSRLLMACMSAATHGLVTRLTRPIFGVCQTDGAAQTQVMASWTEIVDASASRERIAPSGVFTPVCLSMCVCVCVNRLGGLVC